MSECHSIVHEKRFITDRHLFLPPGAMDICLGQGAAGVFTNSQSLWSHLSRVGFMSIWFVAVNLWELGRSWSKNDGFVLIVTTVSYETQTWRSSLVGRIRSECILVSLSIFYLPGTHCAGGTHGIFQRLLFSKSRGDDDG